MSVEANITYEEAMERKAKVIEGVNKGREGRIRGFNPEFGVLFIRDSSNSETLIVNEEDVEVYFDY